MRKLTNLEPHLIPALRSMFAVLPEVAIGTHAIRQERRELEPLREQARSEVFRDERVPRAGDRPELLLRVYRPERAQGAIPALIWMHGGAWSLGGPEFDEHMLRGFADDAGVLAVSVDYRLAPEHPFPAALHDCDAAVRFIHEHAGDFGVDAARICIGGSSAGANLAAGLCLKLRDERGPQPAFQLLMYPALDDRLATPSMMTLADPRTINATFMRDRWRDYLGKDGADSPYAVPVRAGDLAGLPRTLLLTAELDPLRDEGLDYAMRLWLAAVSCEVHVLAGVIHGFDALVPESAEARSALALVTSALQRVAAAS